VTPEQILDSLADAAALEHAHCVYYLRLHYALGGDPPERVDEPPPGVAQAAGAAFAIALNDMFHLKQVNRILVGAGREPVLDRATHAGAFDLAPMSAVHFTRFPEREVALAGAVDAAYAGIRAGLPAVPAPPLTKGLLEDLMSLLDFAGNHAGEVPGLAENLSLLTPAQYLLVTGTAPAGDLDRRLLALSDDFYASLVAILRAHFADAEGFSGLRDQATRRMDDLHTINGILGVQSLLPPFTIA
jgi:hypothetical protein